jgi:hypothetical protein
MYEVELCFVSFSRFSRTIMSPLELATLHPFLFYVANSSCEILCHIASLVILIVGVTSRVRISGFLRIFWDRKDYNSPITVFLLA